jgi:hypothetical protein
MSKSLLLFSVTLLFGTFTFYSAAQEFSLFDMHSIMTIVLIIVFVQIQFTKILGLIFKGNFFTNISYSIFVLLNIYALNLVLNDDFIQSHYLFKAFAVLIGIFICYTLFKMMDEFKRANIFIPSVAFILLVGNIAYYELQPYIDFNRSELPANHIRLVDFKEKPNVYIIFFDSLLPEPILKKHLKIENAPYNDTLNKSFRRFKNFFVDGQPTKKMINMFLT